VDVAKTIIDSIALARVVMPTVLPMYVKGSSDDPFQLTDNIRITGVFLRLILGSSFDSYRHLKTTSDVANSSTAMNIIANSSTAMNIIANSSTAMNIIANSSTALDIMRASNTAIAAIHDSTTGRNILSQSEHLFKWFWTYEIAKYGLLNTPITTTTETITTFGSLSTGSYKWVGSVIAPNGYIYGTPYNATTVLKINPQNDAITTFGSLSTDSAKWYGSVIAPNGYIYGTPCHATTVLKISLSPAIYKAELGSPYYNKL
jgi:hypothetical protein